MRNLTRLEPFSRIQLLAASVAAIPYLGRAGVWVHPASVGAGLLGLGFWLFAANQFEAGQVGIAASGMAATAVTAALSNLGLAVGSGVGPQRVARSASRVLLGLYGMLVSVGAVGAVLFVGAFGLWLPGLAGMGDSILVVATFVGAVPALGIYRLSRHVWPVVGLARWKPIEMMLMPAVAFVLLVLKRNSADGFAVYISWAWAAIIASVVAGGLAVRAASADGGNQEALTGQDSRPVEVDKLWNTVDLSAHRWLASHLLLCVAGLSVLIVLAEGGTEAAGVWFIVGMVSYGLYRLALGLAPSDDSVMDGSSDMGQSGSQLSNVTGTPELFKGQLVAMGWVAVPAVAVFLGAQYILEPFGAQYAMHGSSALGYLSLACIPAVVIHSYVMRYQGAGHYSVALAIQGLLAASCVVGVWIAQYWGGLCAG